MECVEVVNYCILKEDSYSVVHIEIKVISHKKPENKPAKPKTNQPTNKKAPQKTKNYTKGLKYSQSQPTENFLNTASLVSTKVIAK